MKVINNAILIDISLTDEVFENLKFLLTGLDDIKLNIENSTITTKEIDLPDAVSSVYFENCVFRVPTIVSNLKKGRQLSIKNCKKDFFLGNVKLKKIDCNSVIINQREIQNCTESLFLDIEQSLVMNFNYVGERPPVFSEVIFGNKILITSESKTESCDLFFNECKFLNSAQLNIDIISPFLINMEGCVVESRTEERLALVKFTENAIITSLNILKSKLVKMEFNLFSVKVKNIKIINSEIGVLDLSAIDKEEKNDKNHNSIFNVMIINSFVKGLSLKYRKIIHEINFSNTTFFTPPQLQHANISEGSEFPNKNHFIRRNGTYDASCYRALRFIMESQRNRELEGMFFSLEQESLLNAKGKIKKYFSVNYLYYVLSDYGTNYRTPLFILLISIPLFTIIYSIINSPVISTSLPIDWDIVIKSLIITLKQTFLPFDLLRNNDIIVNKKAGSVIGFVLVGVINSILSISLLALSGLALRWKFKRG
ncbi:MULTISPECIES: hypothetical protein [Proteus]|uniref:hypothetical protein n=1 Tax=Proteus TaxID=583 RepID=UPI000BA11B5F|nr:MULTISPECIES: hypothetical protein [Proteus]ELB0940778.1 hypothetical protein [Proteus mirabilis]MBG5958457.1 hypothetical protein [Proteus mirabilis]MBI6221804.1 hypothetical protein [Proteus mirabilis]MBI6225788.1 hypothetical protein [Proteus mirabilis]MDM3803373.1 hypothetical protein [Proteus mirabilis]